MASSLIALRQLLAGLLLTGVATSTLAASLSISPVTVTLDEKTRSAALTLKNEGSESRVIQSELLRWTQNNGENIHTPSRDLLLNPPIVTLQPGQTQIIRVGLNRKADKVQELAYRLYISEVPPPPKEGFTGLRIALRFGIPVFVSPKAQPSSRLSWKATRTPKGLLQLTLLNAGNHHLRLNSVKVSDTVSGLQLAELQQSQLTVLAGQSRQIVLSLPDGWQGRQLSLVSGTEEGLVESKIELEQATK